MLKYVSVAEMVAIEREADANGLTYARMMENAGHGLAGVIQAAYSRLKPGGLLGLVGAGNNGGDTLVALAHLVHWGWRASAYLVKPRPTNDPLVSRLREAGGEIYSTEDDTGFARLGSLLKASPVVLDGVLGTGVHLPLRKDLSDVLAFCRQTLEGDDTTHVVAVDCPSGVECDSGEVAAECISAEITVSMAAAKQGLLKFPACARAGNLHFVGIGLGDKIPYPKAWEQVQRFVPQAEWVKAALPKRPMDAHKGTFGTALVVAGSLNYTGAALLAGKAAFRSGAGLVTLGVVEPLQAALAGHFPEATWVLLPEEDGCLSENAAEPVRSSLERVTALLLGPGFGLSEPTRKFLARLLTGSGRSTTGIGFVHNQGTSAHEPSPFPPVVVDADGLKLLARLPRWPRLLPAPAVLTPHPGEMAALTGLSVEEIQSRRVEIAEQYALEWGHVVVLKGAFTVIAAPDGETAVIPVASPALARAGSGDVLAGIIVGLMAQGMAAFPAAVCAAWLHAQAGLMAAERLGNSASVLAGDLLDGMVQAMSGLGARSSG